MRSTRADHYVASLEVQKGCLDSVHVHELRVQVDVPKDKRLSAHLIGAIGQILREIDPAGQNLRSIRPWTAITITSYGGALRHRRSFEHVAFRGVVGDPDHIMASADRPRSAPRPDQIEQRVRIVFRANQSGIAGTESCLRFEDGALVCPSRAAPQVGPDSAGWQRSDELNLRATPSARRTAAGATVAAP